MAKSSLDTPSFESILVGSSGRAPGGKGFVSGFRLGVSLNHAYRIFLVVFGITFQIRLSLCCFIFFITCTPTCMPFVLRTLHLPFLEGLLVR